MTKKVFAPGFYDISNDEYHNSEGVSRSGIKLFMQSPRHYWYRYINPNFVKTSSDAYEFGNAFHTYILEPKLFERDYFVSKKINRTTTKGKEEYAQSLIDAAGKIMIDESDFQKIKEMKESIYSDGLARELITDAQYEKSIYWYDPDTGLLCKCRPDIWQKRFVVDLKTTADASYWSFQRDIYKYGYHIQMAMIREGLKHALNIDMRDFISLPIEKSPPFCPAIYPFDEAAIEAGLNEFKKNLMAIKICMDKNTWPSYQTQTMTLPRYANGE